MSKAKGMTVDQAALNKQLLENFNRGLERLTAPPEHATLAAYLSSYTAMPAEVADDIGWDSEQAAAAESFSQIVAVAADAVMAARAQWWTHRANDARNVGSPLEAVLGLAIRVLGERVCQDGVTEAWCDSEGHREVMPWTPNAMSVCHQHRIDKYRADLFVTGYERGTAVHSVAIEVDGHEFHERTKEQASRDKERDRVFQRFNFKVFRYSGADVFADPFRCALEIVTTATGNVLDAWRPFTDR